METDGAFGQGNGRIGGGAVLKHLNREGFAFGFVEWLIIGQHGRRHHVGLFQQLAHPALADCVHHFKRAAHPVEPQLHGIIDILG